MTSHRLVFIGGLHRSGTTLLARSLGAHPAVSAFEETGVPEDEGQHLQSVYPPASKLGGPGRFGFARGAHLTERSELTSERSRDKLWRDWSRHWDLSRPVLVEKSPPNLLRTRFLQALFTESTFVMLIRHPIAVALATAKWGHSWEGMTPGRLVKHWVTCYETLERDAAHVSNLQLIRYEDLVAAPDERLANICGSLGLEPGGSSGEVRERVNDRYFAMWRELERSPLRRAYMRRVVERYEDRVSRFGYSLREPERLDSVLAALPGSPQRCRKSFVKRGLGRRSTG